jgi:hypothetical protein
VMSSSAATLRYMTMGVMLLVLQNQLEVVVISFSWISIMFLRTNFPDCGTVPPEFTTFE